MIGTTISHYRITEKLGEGGMGVVYKAEDTNLKRPVALKFLAAHLLGDEEIKARFRRETEAAASLNHPNICTVHEIAEANARTFIAMAFLEGEGLDKKIEAGPLKLKDALDIAIQAAKGLQAAHEKGIVHRDVKPANLMLTGSGSKLLVTIMDFGLALLADRSKLTRLDETMGTVTYMSPEQTYGMDLDHRTDIWSLGVVIYEMVTGQQPFKGHYDKAVMYSITNEEPEPMTALRTGIPMELEILVNKCLAKETEERYQHTDELLLDLQGLRKKIESGSSTIFNAQIPSQTAATQSTSPAQLAAHPLIKYRVIEDLGSRGESAVYRAEDTQLHRSVTINVLPESAARKAERRERLKKIAAGAVFLLLAVMLWVQRAPQSAPGESGPLRRFAFKPPIGLSPRLLRASVAISPNGKHIAFAGAGTDRKLWVQDLDQQQPRAIEGTEGAKAPFWSPDSDFIAFAAGGELKKVSVQGGLATRLCELPDDFFQGGSWSPDGEVIVFSSLTSGSPYALNQVPARGGASGLLISSEELEQSLGGPTGAIWSPYFLPSEDGARILLFTFGTVAEQTMIVQDLETGRRELLGPGHLPFYSASGHIVYQPAPVTEDLWALPFSLSTLKPAGEAFPIAQNGRDPTVAADGTLVYRDGASAGTKQLIWLDRRGGKTGEIGRAQVDIVDPELSPDGRRVAFSAAENSNADIWVYDIARRVKTRLSVDPAMEFRALWSPSGEEVTFVSYRSGVWDNFLRRADGGGEATALPATPLPEWVSDWSRDGKHLLYAVVDPDNSGDLWYFQRKEDGAWEPHAFLQTPFWERTPRLSPDARFVAYSSNESGQFEVYVRPFPEGGGRSTVSSNGGQQPRWSDDGKELFYVEGDAMLAVTVTTSPEFSVGPVTRLFEHPSLTRSFYPQYDVSADGQRFLLAAPVQEDGAEPSIRVVQNWFEEFRGRQQE